MGQLRAAAVATPWLQPDSSSFTSCTILSSALVARNPTKEHMHATPFSRYGGNDHVGGCLLTVFFLWDGAHCAMVWSIDTSRLSCQKLFAIEDIEGCSRYGVHQQNISGWVGSTPSGAPVRCSSCFCTTVWFLYYCMEIRNVSPISRSERRGEKIFLVC